MPPKPVKVLLLSADPAWVAAFREQLPTSIPGPVELVCVEALPAALAQLVCKERVEAVFLDLALPGSQALGVFTALREEVPHVSVIVLSGSEREALALEAIQQGAQDWLLPGECQSRTLARVLRQAQERKRAQDELRERREFSRLISQNVTDLILVLDKEGRRVYHSPSYKCLLENPDAVKGTATFEEIHPEDRAQVQQVLRDTLATGVGQRMEYRFLLKDGRVRCIESQTNVIKDRHGRPFKMVVVSRDITERKQAEQALRESEQRFKRLLDSTTDYIFTVKVEAGRSVGTTHGQGCEALTGYRPEDFQQSPQLWLGMVPDEDRPMVLAQVTRLLQGENLPPLEHRLIRKGGALRWIRNTSVPRKDEAGRVIAYDGLISDITERKVAEERLKHAYVELARGETELRKTLEDLNASHEALKATQLQLIMAEKFESIGTLAAGVAHEVKNPLQTILMGLAYLVNNVPKDNENLQIVVADMRDAVKRADTIVRELLTLSASTHITMRDEDFNVLMERSLWLVNYEINAARINAVRELAPSLPPVRMDKSRLEQVFINLFINAIQAMPGGGTLTVRTREGRWAEGQYRPDKNGTQLRPGDPVVFVEVQDTGIGIPDKNLTKLFDPFFTTKPVGSGSGLGLSVAKQIIELHGGFIDIRNAPHGGALVTIILKAQPATIP